MTSPAKAQMVVWTNPPPMDWPVARIKALFHDDTANISVEQLADLEVDHYSIPAFDEFNAPAREQGATIASNKTLLRGGELLFSKLNSHKPRVWLVPEDKQIKVASTEFIALREWHPGRVDKNFVRYLLGSIVFVDYISCFQTSVTNSHKRISPEDLWRHVIPLPPLPEQERIAAYLDASCAAIDAAVAAKRRQIETLDSLRKSIIHKAVTCGLSDAIELKDSGVEWLGKIPVHWPIKRIKNIVDLKSGDAITSDSITPNGDYPVFGGNGLRGYTNLYTHDGYYVLVGRQGALCGNINYAEGKFWASEHAVVAITLIKHDTFWLGELLRMMDLNQYSNAAAQPGLAVERIKLLRIPVPPYEEQIWIASWLKNTIIKNEKMVSILKEQIDTLTAYRKSLIHECVTGQRRISEADLYRVKSHG